MVSTESGQHKKEKTGKKKRSSASGTTKSRRAPKASATANQQQQQIQQPQETYLNMHYDLPRSMFEGPNAGDEHVYDVVRCVRDDTYENVASAPMATIYQNVDGLYDRPRANGAALASHYENVAFNEHADSTEDDDHTYLNVEAKVGSGQAGTYDVPRSAGAATSVTSMSSSTSAIYDLPASNNNVYDAPKGLVPLSARLLLNARNRMSPADVEAPAEGRHRHRRLIDAATTTTTLTLGVEPSQSDCDTDSLDGDRDATSDFQQCLDRRSGSSPDEGIGELDVKGLDVIVEEAEEPESTTYPHLIYAENKALREVSQRLLKSRRKAAEAPAAPAAPSAANAVSAAPVTAAAAAAAAAAADAAAASAAAPSAAVAAPAPPPPAPPLAAAAAAAAATDADAKPTPSPVALNGAESSLSELDTSSVASASTEDDRDKDPPKNTVNDAEETDRTQRDRCIEVYHETMRQRNNKTKAKLPDAAAFQMTSAKEETGNMSTIRRMRKLLPSVKALRSQFESRSASTTNTNSVSRRSLLATSGRKWKSSSSFKENGDVENNRSRSSSLGSLDEISTSSGSSSSGVASGSSSSGAVGAAGVAAPRKLAGHRTKSSPANSSPALTPSSVSPSSSESVAVIIQPVVVDLQDKSDGNDPYKPRHSTANWDPTALLEALYRVPQVAPDSTPAAGDASVGGEAAPACVNLEGFLEKLPSGRRKATFWNAWKSRFFRLQDGFLYYYQNNQSEKPSAVLQLAGGVVENMDNNMIGVDDGKGHYMVVRGKSQQETERWHQAFLTHVDYHVKENYVQPVAVPRDPKLFKPVITIDLGSSSVRAGILSGHATLPHVFFPSVVAVEKTGGKYVAFGSQALRPDVRLNSALTYPIRPSNKISKYTMDLEGVTGLMRLAFQQLNVDPSTYSVQVNVPRRLNAETQAELVRVVFETFGASAVNLTHQSVLCLLSYNATSGIVVDIGERIDIVPIMDGYMLEASASQVPYGGQQLVDHLRHFLVQQRCSLITEVESYLIRRILEELAFVAGPDAGAYTAQLNKARKDPAQVRATVDLRPFSNGQLPWENVSLELGRFQVTEGLFHPEAWGLDNPGVHTLVHKAIQDCSVDIRKEMARSIYVAGGVTMLPGFPERLEAEVGRLSASHLIPKVHASPYRYHASYLGACALANSPAFDQSKMSRDEWTAAGSRASEAAVRKWKI